MNWFLMLTTSSVIVVALLSLFQFMYIWRYIDQLRERGRLVAYMVLMIAWLCLLTYGFLWLLVLLHWLGLPVDAVTGFFIDLFAINLNG